MQHYPPSNGTAVIVDMHGTGDEGEGDVVPEMMMTKNHQNKKNHSVLIPKDLPAIQITQVTHRQPI